MSDATTTHAASWQTVLSQPETERALLRLIEALPLWSERLEKLDQTLSFAEEVLKDKDSMNYMLEGLQADLPPVTLDKETVFALVKLMDKLPKLVSVLEKIEPAFDFAMAVTEDKDALSYLYEGAVSYVQPALHKAEEAKTIVEEIKKRAQADRTPVTIFGLLKMLKDPLVQDVLITARTALAVLGERKNKQT